MQTDAAAAFAAAQAQYKQTFEKHLANGVNFMSDQVWIDPEVEIAPGATILPGCILRGNTKIGAGCVVGPNSLLENTELGDGSTFNASQAYDSRLGAGNKIGPYTHIRPNTVTGPGVHLGAYVETKNSGLGQGTTVSHLTYIGDSDVGEYCNFGCGTVTSNYDGFRKHRTVIGSDAFIGCNTNLVPPVEVGDGAYIAAGTTVTRNVPADALAVGRVKQENKEGWARRNREFHKKK